MYDGNLAHLDHVQTNIDTLISIRHIILLVTTSASISTDIYLPFILFVHINSKAAKDRKVALIKCVGCAMVPDKLGGLGGLGGSASQFRPWDC